MSIVTCPNLGTKEQVGLILGINSVHFIRKHLGRTGKIACPSFSLSLLFLPLGAVLCLLRLLGFQRNIHAFAYLLKLGNFGAGSFQFGVVGISLRFEVSVIPVSIRR